MSSRSPAAFLLSAHCTLAAAESCTGGMLGAMLTAVPGSSRYFRGGVIAYANDIKRDMLGVKPATLARHGAVSAQTAVQMAAGIRRRFKADLGVATTGIAGPDGGTRAKPVGLVFIAVAGARACRVRRFVFKDGRARIRAQACRAALRMLKDALTPAWKTGIHEAGVR